MHYCEDKWRCLKDDLMATLGWNILSALFKDLSCIPVTMKTDWPCTARTSGAVSALARVT